MARLPQPGQDSGTWGDILNTFLSIEHNTDGTLKASGSAVLRTGDQDIQGVKTFTSSPIIPSPASGSSAVNKTYVDNTAVAQGAVTNKGDLLAATAPATIDRLGVGSNGQILVADSTQATGLRWQNAPTGMGGISESTVSSGFTLTASDNGNRFVAMASFTITVPAVGVLGNGFECEVVNIGGGTVTIDGPGSTNVLMSDGEVANIMELNSTQRVVKGPSTLIS